MMMTLAYSAFYSSKPISASINNAQKSLQFVNIVNQPPESPHFTHFLHDPIHRFYSQSHNSSGGHCPRPLSDAPISTHKQMIHKTQLAYQSWRKSLVGMVYLQRRRLRGWRRWVSRKKEKKKEKKVNREGVHTLESRFWCFFLSFHFFFAPFF